MSDRSVWWQDLHSRQGLSTIMAEPSRKIRLSMRVCVYLSTDVMAYHQHVVRLVECESIVVEKVRDRFVGSVLEHRRALRHKVR